MYHRSLLISCLLTCVVYYHLTAQVKHDANWVFGKNAGVSFLNADTTLTFKSVCSNLEQNGSISDELGNLIFYISMQSLSDSFVIRDAENNIIINSNRIKCNYNITSGAIIIKKYSVNKYLIFHLFPIFNHPACNTAYCTLLYKTVVSMNSCGEMCVESKNELMLNDVLYERMSAVKHANGKDWWLILHTESFVQGGYQNTFIRFLISDTTISEPYYQNIGTARNIQSDFAGQMKVSKNGNKLALIRFESKILELYDIDRCSGELQNFRSKQIINLPTNSTAYGLEFSFNEEYIYSSATFPPSINTNNYTSFLYQFKIDDVSINNPFLISSDTIFWGQLQIAPNNKIFIAGEKYFSTSPSFDNYDQYLSVIHQPDSAGLVCDFRPFSFYLGDSSASSSGLPNFPNYNLGALSIYEADAGRDTVICTDSTNNQKVVPLGSPKINGVQYQWYPNYNLSSDTAAQPLAYPDTSTMYYVMLSDSSIKNACKSRLDSVLVEVRRCNTSLTPLPELASGGQGVRLYPNPAREEITIEIHPDSYRDKNKIASVKVYDVAGREINNNPLQLPPTMLWGESAVSLNLNGLGTGLYFIEVRLSNGGVERVKLMKQ